MGPAKCPGCGELVTSEGRCAQCGLTITAAEAATTEARLAATAAGSGVAWPSPPAELPGSLLPEGARIGEYVVTGVIGQGGMGTVYSGVQPLIDKRVAIKVLKPGSPSRPADARRFLAEARAVNRIGHPNIVDIFGFGALPGGSQYFVMEHLHGRSLEQHLRAQRTVDYGEAFALLAQILDALEAAHAQRIIHRDLKPDNIYLCERTGSVVVKLLDFGVAKSTDTAATSSTGTGVPVGTPLYMSPEQCQGEPIDARTDVYALGVILYRMFTGRVPFTGASVFALLSAHVHEPPAPPSQVADVPPELEALILRCLAKRREDRYPGVAALRAELLPLLGKLGNVDDPAAVLRLRPLPRRSWLPAAALATAAVLGGGASLWLLRGTAPPAASEPRPLAAPAAPPAPERHVLIQFQINPPVPRFELLVDGKKQGRTEVELPWSRDRKVEVQVLAEGYEPYVDRRLPLSDFVWPIHLVKRAPKTRPKRSADAPPPRIDVPHVDDL